MKIGIDARFLDSLKKTGVSNYLTNLIYGLAKVDASNEYTLYYNSLRRNNSDFPCPEQKNFNVKVIKFPELQSRYFNEIWSLLLSASIKMDKVDVAHLMCSAFPLITPYKTVSTIYDLTPYRHESLKLENKNRFKSLKKSFERTLRKSNALIAISESTQKDLVTFFPSTEKKVKVIPLGTYHKKVNIDQAVLKNFKDKFKLGEKNILFVGTLEKRKNIEVLLKAFSLLLKHNANCNYKLILVGNKGSGYDSILKTIEDLQIANHLVLTGYVSEHDLPYFYYSSNIFAFPSIYEGFGLPCIDAMSLGVPIVVSDIPVFREVVSDAGVYFNPKSIEDLYSGLCKIISDSTMRIKMIAKGLEISKKFSWDNMALETLKVYSAVMENVN